MKKRSYKQSCALARALDLVGERWTFLIIRELIIRPKRYKTLVANLKGMGTNLLATRLKELEQTGIIERIAIPDSKMMAYRLTDLGRELEAPLLAIIRWGFKLPIADEEDYLSISEWDLVAMKAAFRPESAQNLNTVVGFKVGEQSEDNFVVQLSKGQLSIQIHEDCAPQLLAQRAATVDTTMAVLMQIDAGELTFDNAVEQHLLRYQGDKQQLQQLLGVFSVNQDIC